MGVFEPELKHTNTNAWIDQSEIQLDEETTILWWLREAITDLGRQHVLPLPSIQLPHTNVAPGLQLILGGLEPIPYFIQSLIWEANDKAEVYRRGFAHSPKFAFKGPQVIFRLIQISERHWEKRRGGRILQIHLRCFFPMVEQIPTANEPTAWMAPPFSQQLASRSSMPFNCQRFFFSFTSLQANKPTMWDKGFRHQHKSNS